VVHREGRKVVTDGKPRYFGIEVNDQSLVPGANPRLGKVHFKDWLSQSGTPQRGVPINV